MPARRLLPILASLLALMLVAAGCGSPSLTKEQYEEEVQRIAQDVQERFDEVAVLGAQGEADRDALRASAAALEDAADGFADLDPPAEIADAHDDMVAAVRSLARMMQRLVELDEEAEESGRGLRELLAGDEEFATQAQEVQEQLMAVTEAYEEAGYGDVFGPVE